MGKSAVIKVDAEHAEPFIMHRSLRLKKTHVQGALDNMIIRHRPFFIVAVVLFLSTAGAAQNSAVIELNVDATDAARGVIRTHLSMPVNPGPLTLFYPKWIPGEHTPTGTIGDVVGLYVTAEGKPITWRRDDVEIFAFHCVVPPGVRTIDVSFDVLAQPGTTASAQLARIKWNRVVVYPQGARSDAVRVEPSLKLPAGWKFATALPVARESAGLVTFKEVTLETLVDSPAIIGANFRQIPLASDGSLHELDIVADSSWALDVKPDTVAGLNRLVQQARAHFGTQPYESYRFLVTLSDVGGDEGLEHHQSSEDGARESAFSNSLELLDLSFLLGHEFAHTWNGKYRRPQGLATTDFEQPMKGELLWIYEGLTDWLGAVLTTRSSLWNPDQFREFLAADAALMDTRAGRAWRPLVDTAIAAQITYGSPRPWRISRRRADFYNEGWLIWLEADMIIRTRSQGRLSLNDFSRSFHGGQNGLPPVKPYVLDDVISTLNDLAPYDWRGFFNERVNLVAPRAPLGGIEQGGWRLVYNDLPNQQLRIEEHLRRHVDLSYSLGLIVGSEGIVIDINPEMAAGKAGLAPGMKIVAVNGRSWSTDGIHQAVAASGATPIEVRAENGSFQRSYTLDYRGGERYPHLERNTAQPDLLTEVTKPLVVR